MNKPPLSDKEHSSRRPRKALTLQRSLAYAVLEFVARGERKDQAMAVI